MVEAYQRSTGLISTGRRNSKLEPVGIENKGQNRRLKLDQPERCSGWVLTEYSQTVSSPAQALPSQPTG
jgi:hypothetical protein